MIKIIYSDNFVIPDNCDYSIFLAGPSPRGDNDPNLNWRIEAISIFKNILNSSSLKNKNIVIYIPLPSTGAVEDYDAQIEWEQRRLCGYDVILMWMPRDLKTLPGFTSNFEMGQFVVDRKLFYGRPEGAPKTKYLDVVYDMYQSDKTIGKTLKETIQYSINYIIDKEYHSLM